MTTKNLEFDFDLQVFATETQVESVSSVLDEVDNTASSATINVSSGGIAVNAGWAATDTLITWTTTTTATDDDDPEAAPTVTSTDAYAHEDNFRYYAFTSTDTTAGAAYITTVNAEYTIDSDTGTAASSITSPPSGLFENTVAGSAITLTGGGVLDNVSIAGTGSIAKLGTNANVGLYVNGSNVRINHVSGEEGVTLTPVNANFKQTINGSAVIATLPGDVVLNGGSDGSAITVSSAGQTNIASIDTKQTWDLGSADTLTYNKLAVRGNVNVTGSDDAGTYLAVNVDEGNSVSFSTVGSGVKDTVSVNGTVLSGLAVTGAVVTADSSSSMTAEVSSQGTISANGAVGGAAVVAAGAEVGITAGEDTDNIPAITSVSKLANNGYWTLGSGVISAYLGNDTVDFVDGGNTLRADATGSKVAAFTATNGNATLTTGDSHVVSVNGAAWNITNASASPVSAVFNSLGTSATMSIAGDGSFNVSVNSARTLSAGANGAAW